MKFEFQKLAIYQKAKEFHLTINTVVQERNLRPYERDQLNRAPFSVVLNIAEGSGRFSKKDRQNFFIITRSSVFECVAILDILNERQVISKEEFNSIADKADELSRMLYSMIKNLNQALIP